MSKVYVKLLTDGKIVEAPRNYKNISNFNKFPSIMEKYGFRGKIKAYNKADGTMSYIDPTSWEESKTEYTEVPYVGSDYEWNEEKAQWIEKLEVAKANKLQEIRCSTNRYMDLLKKNFSNAEMETWARQENGLKLLMEDINSEEYDAEWVRNLAITRGITLQEQMQRITVATSYMNDMAYQLVGYQQRLEDAVNAATTIDEVYSVKFELIV